MGIHTIIGAESFHGPVRDGKAWVQLAMAARLKGYKSVKPFARLMLISFAINQHSMIQGNVYRMSVFEYST